MGRLRRRAVGVVIAVSVAALGAQAEERAQVCETMLAQEMSEGTIPDPEPKEEQEAEAEILWKDAGSEKGQGQNEDAASASGQKQDESTKNECGQEQNEEPQYETDEVQTEKVEESETQPEEESETQPKEESETQPEEESETQPKEESETQPEEESEAQSKEKTQKQSEASAEENTQEQNEEPAEEKTQDENEVSTEEETQDQNEELTEEETQDQSEELIEEEIQDESEDLTEEEIQDESEELTEMEPGEGTGQETQETEQETYPDTEEQTQTEKQERYEIRVSNIRVAPGSDVREYDGTDHVQLLYDTACFLFTDEEPEGTKQPMPSGISLTCDAHLSGTDAGEQKVLYQFQCDALPEGWEFSAEEVSLNAVITPRRLTIHIPNGWKLYGAEAQMDHIHPDGEVRVSGFVCAQDGSPIIPKEFVLPAVEVDHTVLGQFSPIWKDGKEAVYESALVPSLNSDGSISGNPGRNYTFSTDAVKGGAIWIAPNTAVEGRDYRIGGLEGAYVKGEDGIWYYRGGTELLVLPLEGSGYNTGTPIAPSAGAQTGEFTLLQTGQDGSVLARSQPGSLVYCPDFEVPAGQITVSGEAGENGILYSKDPVTVSFHALADPQSGLAEASYSITSGEGILSGEFLSDNTAVLEEEGSYRIEARTRDRVGNEASAPGVNVVIDKTPPQIEISGIQNGGAYAGSLSGEISCTDEHFKAGSMKVTLEKAFGSSRQMKTDGSQSMGDTARIGGFPESPEQDGYYTLHVEAQDLAGNTARETISFSVNRYGSSFSLSSRTQGYLASYFHRDAFPVTFEEHNIDQVGEARIYVRREDTLAELSQGQEYSVKEGGTAGNRKYSYTIPAGVFQEEGAYEVMLMSTDAAGNTSDTASQLKSVSFAIDRTAPQILFAGARNGDILYEDEAWISAQVWDSLQMDHARLLVDGEEAVSLDAAGLVKANGLIRLKLEPGDNWRTIQVEAGDAAGNVSRSDQIAVYIAGPGAALEDIPDYEPEQKTNEAGPEAGKETTAARKQVSDMKKKRAGFAGLFYGAQPGKDGVKVESTRPGTGGILRGAAALFALLTGGLSAFWATSRTRTS